jgi:hypothetical protein
MTPTLIGRWQTRLLLFATLGILVTLPFALGYIGSPQSPVFFAVLGYVALFGLAWDAVYTYIQKFRWDRDWPAVFQLAAGVWEALFLLFLIKLQAGLNVNFLAGIPQDLALSWFAAHYSCVWLAIFIASQSLMRILFPRWRFRGGRLF